MLRTYALQQHVVALLALAAADDLADSRGKDIHCSHSAPVIMIIRAHVERLDLTRIVGDDDRFFEHMLGKITLVFRLKIGSPSYRILPRLTAALQQGDSLSISYVLEPAGHELFEGLDYGVVDPFVKELQIISAAFHHMAHHELQELFRYQHVAL